MPEISEFNQFHFTNRGGVLIEFAFSIPVLISLLFFVNDHYRYYELKDKIKSSAYLAAGMIQQLGNTRENKQLIYSDFQQIAYASCLNFFHTTSMFKGKFGVYYNMECYWVKRVSQDNYQFQDCYANTGSSNAVSPSGLDKGCFKISTKTMSQIQSIHPDLVCTKDNDERLLIECSYRKNKKYPDYKKQLGFYILEPGIIKDHQKCDCFFLYQVVIAPKPGLFPAPVTRNKDSNAF